MTRTSFTRSKGKEYNVTVVVDARFQAALVLVSYPVIKQDGN